MTTDEFFAKYDDKYLDFDGMYGNQCVDLIKAYFNEVLGIEGKARGNAIDYWNNCPELDQIPNSPDGVPQKGDVIVWNTDIGSKYGHIGIAKGWGSTSQFDSFDQNYPVGSPCHFVRHTYKGVIGWLRPKQAPAPQPAPQPVPQTDSRDARIAELEKQNATLVTQIDQCNKEKAELAQELKNTKILLSVTTEQKDKLQTQLGECLARETKPEKTNFWGDLYDLLKSIFGR